MANRIPANCYAYLEGNLEGAHLIEDAAEAPDVALVIIRLSLAQLRRDVARRADHRVSLALAVQDFADAEVADLGVVQRPR